MTVMRKIIKIAAMVPVIMTGAVVIITVGPAILLFALIAAAVAEIFDIFD